jgi:hypothetical protein
VSDSARGHARGKPTRLEGDAAVTDVNTQAGAVKKATLGIFWKEVWGLTTTHYWGATYNRGYEATYHYKSLDSVRAQGR